MAIAQIKDPVKWVYSAKKITDTQFELQFTATIEKDWHLYSQFTPAGGPVPTSFSFTPNPLATQIGKIKENGKLEQKNEPIFGVVVKQFSNKIVFTQLVKLKAKVPTSIIGKVEYMACNNKECLAPVSRNFSITLQ